MIVFTTLMFFGAITFFVPRKYLRYYMIIAAVGISSLYFFFNPHPSWDLYRHYEALAEIRKLDLRSIILGTFDTSQWLVEDYKDSTRLYLVYAYLIGLLNNDKMLTVITGVIIYTVASRIIVMTDRDIGEGVDDWKLAFCFFFLLAALDFRTISGIRNMMAYVLFVFVLYLDLVRKKNTLLCLVAYVLLTQLHSSIYILLVLRVFMMFRKVVPTLVLAAAALLLFSFSNVISEFLTHFSSSPAIVDVINKINGYSNRSGMALMDAYVIIRYVRLVLTIIYLLLYRYVMTRIPESEKYRDYGEFFLLVIMFALGAYRQYDTFVRSNIVMYFMACPFVLLFLKHVVTSSPFELELPRNVTVGFSEFWMYMMILIIIVFSLIIYLAAYYPSMDSGFMGAQQQTESITWLAFVDGAMR